MTKVKKDITMEVSIDELKDLYESGSIDKETTEKALNQFKKSDFIDNIINSEDEDIEDIEDIEDKSEDENIEEDEDDEDLLG